MKQASLFVFFILILPMTGAFAQSHSPERQAEALRGLRSLTLIVGILWTNAKPEDPTKEDEVWAIVAKRLRDVGIDVRHETYGTEPDVALRLLYVYTRVNDTLYFSGYLRLTEQVLRVQPRSANLWASTWEWQFGGAGSSHQIDDAIDEFLREYKQTNGGKRPVNRRHPTNRWTRAAGACFASYLGPAMRS